MVKKMQVTKVLPLMAALLVGIVASLVVFGAFSGSSPFGSVSESSNTQIINAIERKEQVVLLSLGIQGLSEKTEKAMFFGQEVPGSEKASFIQYSFNAKLGIEGKDVRIKQAGEKEILVSIPDFIFIGHNNENFKLAAESGGILSWTAPEIDTVEMINNILNDEAKNQYVASNREILQDQAKAFYTGIISSIDPTVVVSFKYSESS